MQKNSSQDKNTDQAEDLNNELIKTTFKFALSSAGAFIALHYNSQLMAHNQELYRKELTMQRATQTLARKLITLEQRLSSSQNYTNEEIEKLKKNIVEFEQEIINYSSANACYIQHWLEKTNQMLLQLDQMPNLTATNRSRP